MTTSDEESRDWMDTLADWVAARWRWLVVAVLLIFAFNNFAGLLVGITGLLAFANRVVGRVLGARRVVQQVQQIVTGPDDPRGPDDAREEVGTKPLIPPPDRRP